MSIRSTSTILKITRDGGSNVTYRIPWAKYGTLVYLVANTEQVIPVPNNFDSVLFSFDPGSTVLVAPEDAGALAFPAPGSSLNTIAEINPFIRSCQDDTGIRLLSDTTALIKLNFFNIEKV